MQELRIKTDKKEQYVDITERVKDVVRKQKNKNGFVFLHSPHTTAALLLQENFDGSVPEDILDLLDKITSMKKQYLHNKVDNNAKSHMKASLLKNNLIIAFENNELVLGTWQRILFFEFDGPRSRKILLEFFGFR